jgi:hypothetical protein
VPAPGQAGWQFQGGAVTDGSTITLTQPAQTFVGSIAAYRSSMPSEGFHVTFDGYMGGGGGADGMTFALLDADAYGGFAGSSGGGLGYSGLSGIAVTMDTFANGSDPSSNFMGIATSGSGSDITYVATDTSVPGLRANRSYEIEYTGGHLIVHIDGVQVFDQVIAVPSKMIPAFTAGTGGSADEHSVSNIVMTYEGGGAAGTSPVMPAGMSVSTSSLASSTAITPGNWGNAAQNQDALSWTYATGETVSAGTLVVNGISHNPTLAGTYYAQLITYSDVGCTTSVDSASAAFVITNEVEVEVDISPALLFSVAGYNAGTCNGATIDATSSTPTAVPFGDVTSAVNRVAAQTLSVSTNAVNGYTVYARTSGVMTSAGGDTVADWTGTNANPTTFPNAGTEAFGYSTDDTLSAAGAGTTRFQSDKWAGFTGTNFEVSYASSGYVSDTTHVCYQIGVSTATAAGAYSTKVIFTAVPSY